MSLDLSPLGFRKTPFTRELSVAERFVLPYQTEAAEALAEAVRRRMSAALIAPAGTGKTVALRVLVSLLPETRYQVRYVKVTGLSKRDLCKEIAAACGLSPTGIYPALVRKLQDAFEYTSGADGMRSVIVLDEAHDLRPEALAMLRLLTDGKLRNRVIAAGKQRVVREFDNRQLTQELAGVYREGMGEGRREVGSGNAEGKNTSMRRRAEGMGRRV